MCWWLVSWASRGQASPWSCHCCQPTLLRRTRGEGAQGRGVGGQEGGGYHLRQEGGPGRYSAVTRGPWVVASPPLASVSSSDESDLGLDLSLCVAAR